MVGKLNLKWDYTNAKGRNSIINNSFMFLEIRSWIHSKVKRTITQFNTFRGFAAAALFGPVQPEAYGG